MITKNDHQLPVTGRGLMGGDGTSDEDISKGPLSAKGLIVEAVYYGVTTAKINLLRSAIR